MMTLEQAPSQPVPVASDSSPGTQHRTLRIAFLLSRYPAISHTFFLKEVLGLRKLGLTVKTASINQPDRPIDALYGSEADEADSTFYVKDGSWFLLFLRTIGIAFAKPLAVLRGLSAIARLPHLTLRQRTFWLLYLAEALLVGRWMTRNQLRHLHVHFGGPVASVGMLTSIAWKIPYSLTIHGPEELLDVSAYQLREKIQQASFVFCISDFCRSQLCQLTSPSDWDKFSVIRLGVDPAAFTPVEPNEKSSSKPLHLVCTGRLVPAKGHRILLEAIDKLIRREIPLRVTLIGDGPERASLESFIGRYQLQEHVTFAGALSHDQTLRHVRSADIFVLASFAEGIPVALMEAMAYSVPCISTSIAGIPELIRTGIDGILVAPSNVQELADAIESLTADASLRGFLGSSARQRILLDYNLPINQERLACCFLERLSSPGLSGETA